MAVEVGALAKVRFGQWAGPILRTQRAGKDPRGCGEWGLGSSNRKGPGVPPHPWSQRAGDLT